MDNLETATQKSFTGNGYIKGAASCALFLLLLLPAVLFAQNITTIPKLQQEPVLDGRLDEPFWSEMEPLHMTMYMPVYRGDITEKTEVYLAYDENYIYLAGKMYHRDTDDIRSNSLYRDQYSSDDTFALILDTFNDNENALWFFTNPDGNRFDVLVSNDGTESNFDWDTWWDAETERTDWGWSAEMRIPFSSLGFQSENGDVVMGVIAYRYLTKLNQRYIYPDIPPEYDDGFRKPSLAQKVRLTGIDDSKPVYFTPYLLGGYESESVLNDNATGYRKERNWTHEPGLDLKLNMSSNLTLDLTVNTDFAQVEADDQQVNLTRFPLFFPEKRQFFQERSSLFNFGFSRNARLFHSRRIGLSATGEPIRIYGGARAVGRLGTTDFGGINMQTAASGDLSSENFTVLRVKRRVFNRYSTIGGMFTSRIGSYSDDNYAYGMDAVIRVLGDEYMTLKLAQTYEGGDLDLLSNSRIAFRWERRRNEGLSYNIDFDRSGEQFNPDMGFVMRRDFTLLEKQVQYKWITDDSPLIQDLWLNNFANAYFRNSDGLIESAVINPHAGLNTKGGTNYRIQTNIRYESLMQPFTLSAEDNVVIPAGDYWYPDVEMSYRAPNGWKLRPGAEIGIGGYFDGRRITLGAETEWNLSSHFEISNEYEYNKVRFGNRGQEFEAHIARLRFRAALNRKVSLTTFAQYSSRVNKTSINARFRYHFAEGNDLWIVYDNVMNTERSLQNLPRLPLSGYQALLAKYTYTFKL